MGFHEGTQHRETVHPHPQHTASSTEAPRGAASERKGRSDIHKSTCYSFSSVSA